MKQFAPKTRKKLFKIQRNRNFNENMKKKKKFIAKTRKSVENFSGKRGKLEKSHTKKSKIKN